MRRTQEERSAATRERLLEATIDCLYIHGYAGTTVTRIAERAGVTRGAQVHHYRTKDDLVTAAVAHLAAASAELGWAQVAALADAPDPVGGILDVIWDLHKTPMFAASVELWVAARADDELRAHVTNVEPRLYPDLPVDQIDTELLDAVYTAMDAVRGLVLAGWHLSPRGRLARYRRARERLRLLFPPEPRVRKALRHLAESFTG